MSNTFRSFITLLVAAAATPAGAGSMNTPHCKVIGGNKLPAASGGQAALCSAVDRAFAAHAAGVAYNAEITVVSTSRLKAKVIANGRTLPTQGFNSMDRPLANSSFERFAKALAEQAAGRSE